MNIKVCLPEKKRWLPKENALHRLLHSVWSMGHSMLVAQAFTLSAEHGSLNAHCKASTLSAEHGSLNACCTGFYTQCGAWLKWVSQQSYKGFYTQCILFFQKLPHARTSALKVGCSKWQKGCKPIEETNIDLYTVKKIMHPCLPAYSRWGILKLHDGFCMRPEMSNIPRSFHG